MTPYTKKIIIIGGGFAGLNLIMKLTNHRGFSIILVDRNNYNFFPPLLYQIASGFLDPSSISYPFRRFLRKRKNVRFRMAEFIRVIPEENKVILSNGSLDYDYLIFATGAESNFFGMKNVEQDAIPMKSMSDALTMRNTILQSIEAATRTSNIEERKKLVTIVVAGAGPTGVELSGMFAEMRNSIIRKDYPELLGTGLGEIYLIDGGDAVLGPMTIQSQKYSQASLEKLGVKIRLNVTVRDYKNGIVYFSDDTTIATRLLIWAAGVTGCIFEGLTKESYGNGKRLLVNNYNKINGYENIYALGDTCLQTTDPAFPNGHPQLAQVAIQQAKNLGKNFLKKDVVTWNPFVYNDKGSMAIIGRNKAVADLTKPKWHFNGFIAWVIWLFIHVMSLLNFRNRLRTFYNWVGAYFTKDQYFRMIIQPKKQANQTKI